MKINYDPNYYNVTIESSTDNPFHQLINYSKALILEAEVGKPMWFVYYLEDDVMTPWHRVCTSVVNDIIITNGDLVVKTQNSVYTFI